MNANTNTFETLNTTDLALAASLRAGQLRRNRTQAAAQRALVGRIEAALDRSPAAVVRALELLYARQTSDEQVTASTRHDNERGFSQAHASRGTWLVTTVIAEGRNAGRAEADLLRGTALEMGRAIAKRYARTQLLRAAYEKAEAERSAFVVPPPSAFGFVVEPSTVTVQSLAVELGDVEPVDESRPATCIGCQWAGKCENGWVMLRGTEYPCNRS